MRTRSSSRAFPQLIRENQTPSKPLDAPNVKNSIYTLKLMSESVYSSEPQEFLNNQRIFGGYLASLSFGALLLGVEGTMQIGLPSLRACAVFFLTLCTSLHMVPLEIFILCPASSCDNPSISTSLKASTSANSTNTGSVFPGGSGLKLVMGGITSNVTGFGNLPLLPYRCLLRHITFSDPLFFFANM